MRKLSLLVCVLCTVSSYAFPLTPAQSFARVKGKPLLSAQLNGGAPEFKLIKTISDGDNPTCYIISSEGKTLILSASSNTQPLLAELDGEYVPGEEEMSGMQYMLDKYSHEISDAEKSTFCFSRQAFSHTLRSEPWENYKKIDPLIQVEWGQGAPYNQYLLTCSNASRKTLNYVTGCGATALAQIAHYWRTFAYNFIPGPEEPDWKRAGGQYEAPDGFLLPDNSEVKIDVIDLLSNEAIFTYDDFQKMQNRYKPGDLADSQNVARLMKVCGYVMASCYQISTTPTGFDPHTSSNDNYMDFALKIMGYSSRKLSKREKSVSDNAWIAEIYNQLRQKFPVIYAGWDFKKNSAHWFIIDGFQVQSTWGNGKSPMVHVRWGWNGRYDGFYSINNLSVNGQQYNDHELAFINCVPTSYPGAVSVFSRNNENNNAIDEVHVTNPTASIISNCLNSTATDINQTQIYKTTRDGKKLIIK